VSIFLLAVALGMTVIIVGVLTKNVAATENTGTSADYAQSAILTVSSFVKDAVSPTAAASASLNQVPISSTCWGSSDVTSEEGNSVDGWPSPGDETELNQTTGIIFAHDFDLEFCGYGSDSVSASALTPNVYEIFVNAAPGMCTNNYCPVDIWDYGNSPYQKTYEYASAWPHGLPSCNGVTPCAIGNLVGTVGKVWCDQACQQVGIACSSINSASTNGLSALPTNSATLCPANYAGTPPLFNYYTSEGDPLGATSLNWVNAYTMTSLNPLIPPNVNVNSNVSACQPASTASCGPMDLYSPADDLNMQTVQDIVLNMTVLGQDNPNSTSAKPSSVQITNQILMRDLAQ
jgi:hypothetical protein